MGEAGVTQEHGTKAGPVRRRRLVKRTLGCAAVILGVILLPDLAGYATGLVLLLVASGIPVYAAYRLLGPVVVVRNRPLLPAYALLAGNLGLAVLATCQGVPTATAMSVVDAALLAWLFLRPGRVVTALVLIYGSYMIIGHGMAVLYGYSGFAASGRASQTVAGYLFVAVLWLAMMWFTVRGMLIIRRMSTQAQSAPRVVHKGRTPPRAGDRIEDTGVAGDGLGGPPIGAPRIQAPRGVTSTPGPIPDHNHVVSHESGTAPEERTKLWPWRRYSKKTLLLVLLVLAFAYFVWPTPYFYLPGPNGVPVRVNRFTGAQHYLYPR